ncbi:MAG TPA: GGDEF domain-containing protein [Gemmatimonadales bacterium]|nr:GGDEF domain-containing protein [Gemmatimonadales bacterium]
MIEFAAGAALGALGAWAGSRLVAESGSRSGKRIRELGPHLLPEPALEWLLRANGALGIWINEIAPGEEGPRAERLIESEHLSVTQIAAVDRRLERARDQEQGGAERLETGTLIFRAGGGAAVGMLLPQGRPAAALTDAERDLDRLLDAVRRRPQIVALAQAQTQEASLESVGSVGLRLAYQLERSLDAEVVVAAAEERVVRVVGVSGRADRRLLDSVLAPFSDLARVALGELAQTLTGGDPLGGAVNDRRQRQGASLLIPILVGSDPNPIGAVAVYLPTAAEPAGPARAELMEALANAGPRLARALAGERANRQAKTDTLTGLANRRALDEAMRQLAVEEGALIYADLDRFKQLNDSLGHAAGDAALVHFARIIREQVRAGDTAARIGGEEFAVWLPRASLALGMRIAERIRIKVSTTPWDWSSKRWPLSASFGVAACPETNTNIENLAGQADAALYVAKTNGRNRVEAAGAGAPPT